MRVAVVGGRLQGVEAAYLANKAGWEVVLIDRETDVPASGLCHSTRKVDVTDQAGMLSVLRDFDLIIPALEDPNALHALEAISLKTGVPLAFDGPANRITRSKIDSNELFSTLNISTPDAWPACGFPVVCKPSNSSGSKGVRIAGNDAELERFSALPEMGEQVIQQYVDGPLYSIEVLGFGGAYFPLQVTDLEVDAAYDCKRVLAPTGLSPDTVSHFENIAVRIAESLRLEGVMDVEAILHEGQLKVLEIDARLPSQTPTAVFASSGMNIVKMLGEMFLYRKQPEPIMGSGRRYVIFEHVSLTPGRLEFAGEHIMAEAGPLRLLKDFFGIDEALTNYSANKNSWVATLVTSGHDSIDAWQKRDAALQDMRKRFDVVTVLDPEPVSRTDSMPCRAWENVRAP